MTEFTRKSKKISPRNYIHIYTNGYTELSYFSQKKSKLHNSNIVLKPIFENAGSPAKLLSRISRQYDRGEISKNDMVFCVMDVDDITNKAIQDGLNNKKKVELILSNPNFEIWILLHFKYFSHLMMKNETVDEVQQFIPNYIKPNIDPFFSILQENEEVAIKNAKKLRQFHEESNVDIYSRESNPSTKIDVILDNIASFIQTKSSNS
jgi:hypothetical protein